MTAFTFRLRFSEEIGISRRTLQDHVEVGNGSATNARRIDGRHDLWEIAVQPATTADVTLAVPPSAACGEPGAICDRATGTTPLSNRLEATVAGPSEEAEVSIAAGPSPVPEGTAAAFVLSRTGSAAAALTVTVSVTETEAMLAANPPSTVAFGAGESSVTLTVPTDDDGVVEAASVVTAEVEDGDDYGVASGAASAEVTVEDNDEAEFTVSADPVEIAEGESSTLTVEIANGVTFAEDQTITLDLSGSTATPGDDYTVSPESPTLAAGAASVTATLTAVDDSDGEGAETVSVAAAHRGVTIGTATVTITDGGGTALTAEFKAMPETHDGQAAFDFELHFSEHLEGFSYRTLEEGAFEMTGGAVTGARRLNRPSNQRWGVTVAPASAADVVIVLPATSGCTAAGAVCTGDGRPLTNRLEARVKGPGSQLAGQGFSLAPDNGSPGGIWSDGATAWVSDLEDGRVYAYRLADGSRAPGRDIATGPAPLGLWSDGETLWVAGLGGGLSAHRLSDGVRVEARDLALGATTMPTGVWSDGETAWVSEWLGDRVHAYRLSDGGRVPGREIELAGDNLLPVGLWSDGETLWVADWEERLYGYRLSDGARAPERDVSAGSADEDPSGLWSDGEVLLATSWEDREVRAYRLPAAAAVVSAGRAGGGVRVPGVADVALAAGIAAALGKSGGEAVSPEELAGLESLDVRNAGVRDLGGLEGAAALHELDLGFNPLADLSVLGSLPALASLNLDGVGPDLAVLAPLIGLERLSLRGNRLAGLRGLPGLPSLTELDVGDNRIADLSPLRGRTALRVLRADRNRISDLLPLQSLSALEELDLGWNPVEDLRPLAGLAELRVLRLPRTGLTSVGALSGLGALGDLGLAGNAVEEVGAVSALTGLRRLDLRGNAVGDLGPLRGLPGLLWVHVGGSGIEDLAPLEDLSGLTVAGRDDRERPEADEPREVMAIPAVLRFRGGSSGGLCGEWPFGLMLVTRVPSPTLQGGTSGALERFGPSGH